MTDVSAHRAGLDAAMRDALNQLALCSHSSAMNLQPKSTASKAEDSQPVGDTGPMDGLRRAYGPPFHLPTERYPGAQDDDQRAGVIRAARAELKSIRGGEHTRQDRPLGETVVERDRRITHGTPKDPKTGKAESYRGWPPKDVANKIACTERDVERARIREDMDPQDGKPMTDGTEDRPTRARRLRKTTKLSNREIARLIGVNEKQVRRWIGDKSAETTRAERRAA